jgi:hypothetical protein
MDDGALTVPAAEDHSNPAQVVPAALADDAHRLHAGAGLAARWQAGEAIGPVLSWGINAARAE